MNEEKIEIKWNPFNRDNEATLDEAIKKLFELYGMMTKVGFSKYEALALVCAMVSGVMK